MQRWQQEARQLPVTVKPFFGETVLSLTRRLSEANGLPETAVLRAAGEWGPGGTGLHIFDRDAKPNQLALERLATMSGIPVTRLNIVLPGIHEARDLRLPTDYPALRWFRPWPPSQPACRQCALRYQAPGLLARQFDSTMMCHRHQRWIRWQQVDVSSDPAVSDAHRRYLRLMSSKRADRQWLHGQFKVASEIVQTWVIGKRWHPDLAERWQDRIRRLRLAWHDHPVICFPETVTLAETITDLDIRRELALVPDWKLPAFFATVAQKTGANKAELSYNQRYFRQWVDKHRHRFSADRHECLVRRLAKSNTPPPESGHFK
ncbi:hypothetical protein GCM10010442_82370 [Kitasatospora kifunensis]